jgi:chemotaxis protein CheC
VKSPIEELQSPITSLLEQITKEGVKNAVRVLSKLVGEELAVSEPDMRLVPFIEIPNIVNGPETKAVCIYLQIEGIISGQLLMIAPYLKAIELIDLLMSNPKGTTKVISDVERTALAGLGNISASSFLNAIALSTGIVLRTSTPAVIVDMVGVIMDIILATSENLSDMVLLIQTKVMRNDHETQADLWIVPDRKTLNSLNQEVSMKNG